MRGNPLPGRRRHPSVKLLPVGAPASHVLDATAHKASVSFLPGRTLRARTRDISPTRSGPTSKEHVTSSSPVRHVTAMAGSAGSPASPSLVGLDPQYLVPAMKAYVTGQRKHDLKKALLSGVSDAELNEHCALLCAANPRANADAGRRRPSAWKGSGPASGGCRRAEAVAGNPMWPSLAGQRHAIHSPTQPGPTRKVDHVTRQQ